MKPFHGVNSHPLSVEAISVLRSLQDTPRPRKGINPGIVNRLLRGSLIDNVKLPSPYKSNKGADIDHLRINDAGRAELVAYDARRAAQRAEGK